MSRWIESRFAKGKVPPFSFVYDGKPSAGLLRKWKYMAQRVESSEPGVREYLYSYQDRRSGLKVECRVKGFADFGAVEWVLNFKNLSDANSATIEQVKVVDLNLTSPGEGGFTVHYADGSHVSKADFHQRTKVLAPGDSLYMAPEGGRSSQNAFPFFNIEAPDGRGAMVAVGWSGTWFADVAAGSKGGVTLSAGQKNLSAYLYPSETIRTPSVCLLFWQGENRFPSVHSGASYAQDRRQAGPLSGQHELQLRRSGALQRVYLPDDRLCDRADPPLRAVRHRPGGILARCRLVRAGRRL